MTTKRDKFNKRMDDLFYSIPGCWYGSMPRIENNGRLITHGNIALNPERAGHGIEVLSRHFRIDSEIQLGVPEPSGVRALIVGFYMTAKDEAKARIIANELQCKAPIALSNGTIIIHTKLANGATNATPTNRGEMTPEEWQEYCGLVVAGANP